MTTAVRTQTKGKSSTKKTKKRKLPKEKEPQMTRNLPKEPKPEKRRFMMGLPSLPTKKKGKTEATKPPEILRGLKFVPVKDGNGVVLLNKYQDPSWATEDNGHLVCDGNMVKPQIFDYEKFLWDVEVINCEVADEENHLTHLKGAKCVWVIGSRPNPDYIDPTPKASKATRRGCSQLVG